MSVQSYQCSQKGKDHLPGMDDTGGSDLALALAIVVICSTSVERLVEEAIKVREGLVVEDRRHGVCIGEGFL